MGSFWFGKQCCVTGVDGFLGSNVAKALLDQGARVVGLSPRPKSLSSLSLLPVKGKFEHFDDVDVTDLNRLRKVLGKENFDACFHFAATATLTHAATSPLRTFEVNVRGTWNLLDVARSTRAIRALIVASSDKAYGDHGGGLPYREFESLCGIHVYDSSKACLEHVCHTYLFQFNVPLRVTRCSNIYGPGDLNFSRLIPGTILRILLGLPPAIHEGHEETLREYLFVDDAVDASLKLAETVLLRSGDPMRLHPQRGRDAWSSCCYNIGGGQENVCTVRAVIEAISMLLPNAMPPVSAPRVWPTVVDIFEQQEDSSKICNETGWRPRVELLDSGLQRTIDWYKEMFPAIEKMARAALSA